MMTPNFDGLILSNLYEEVYQKILNVFDNFWINLLYLETINV